MQALSQTNKYIYAIGQLGWSILMNIVNLQLVYFYIPTSESGIPEFIPQVTFLVVLNTLTILAASGRIFDAITDPIIAALSDKHEGKRGRRVPFMKWGAVPAAVFCLLLFLPPSTSAGWLNIAWLFVIQLGFYISLTLYVTPYFALMAEIGHTGEERLSLSMWISITYALGIVLASQAPAIAGLFGEYGVVSSLQFAIAILASIAVVCMLAPAFLLDEVTLTGNASRPPKISISEALKSTFANQHFKYYVVADFAYFTGLTITMTGLLYYITVLLHLPESSMGLLLPLMVLISFVFYPLVKYLADKYGKKRWVVYAFYWLVAVFGYIYFLGRMPMDPWTQAFVLIAMMSIPIAFLGILPNAILSDIAHQDSQLTGVRKEGMFFAARTLLQKFGQTLGVVLFASMTIFGKDIGNDFGIRLSGIVGAVLCLLAGLYFSQYNESKVLGDEKL